MTRKPGSIDPTTPDPDANGGGVWDDIVLYEGDAFEEPTRELPEAINATLTYLLDHGQMTVDVEGWDDKRVHKLIGTLRSPAGRRLIGSRRIGWRLGSVTVDTEEGPARRRAIKLTLSALRADKTA